MNFVVCLLVLSFIAVPALAQDLSAKSDPPTDENSSIWIRVQQTHTDEEGETVGSNESMTVGASQSETTSTGIDNEDIGVTGSDNRSDPGQGIIKGGVPSDSTGSEREDIGAPNETSQNNETNLEFLNERVNGKDGDDNKSDDEFRNKGDLINKIVHDAIEAGYDDIGRIVSETASDGKAGGNVEFSWKVEEGEKGVGGDGDIIITGGYSGKSKPKEIVVVGSKVRGWDPKDKEALESVAPPADAVGTANDLALFTANTAANHVGFREIRVDDTHMVLSFDRPAKWFGLFETSYTEEITVTFGDGGQEARVKVKFPWYHVLMRKNTSGPSSLTNELDETISENVSFNYTKIEWEYDTDSHESDPGVTLVEAAAKTLQAVSNIMKMRHDSAMAIIRKIG